MDSTPAYQPCVRLAQALARVRYAKVCTERSGALVLGARSAIVVLEGFISTVLCFLLLVATFSVCISCISRCKLCANKHGVGTPTVTILEKMATHPRG